jgi:hypothetical protein
MREERNHQQWIRLAEMSYEQMEEVRRKQREYQQYRERKKAMSQSSSADLGIIQKLFSIVTLLYSQSNFCMADQK